MHTADEKESAQDIRAEMLKFVTKVFGKFGKSFNIMCFIDLLNI